MASRLFSRSYPAYSPPYYGHRCNRKMLYVVVSGIVARSVFAGLGIGIVSASLPTLHKLVSSRFHFDSTEMPKRRKRKGDAKVTPGSTGNATAGKIADTIGSIHVVQ
ncbi:hypothetical protein FOXG_16829 [Fusarium oxysporum f. sp. lycopersici 4287]|uniref:Uncharacterized protein n=3 Tax=Fusarium oxysporum TaxID=5507 RepID=A0A0J9W9L5_FUSO4|nr:hypothetical protein FOXG_16829 [Fusarium oxysporum f. sp. lycopersici 4287]KNB19578.1 hypothetical protein FOXG_16829 [Fusarium oxysporum f. sp. lycopersici 4287]